MFYKCVLVPAVYLKLREKYGDEACKHCIYNQYGCLEKEAITFNGYRYIPIEESKEDLPKCKIWCKNCKAENGLILHEVLWNGRHAYAIKCHVCGAEFLLYKGKVHAEYTGYVNMNGEYVSPHKYRSLYREFCAEDSRRSARTEVEHVATFGEETGNSAMKEALKKAGII